jgi:hypothetical protein
MKIQYFNDQIPYIIIDDFYTVKEQNEIMLELDYLTEPRRMIPALEDGDYSAGKELKNVPCQYLDPFFQDRKHSSILQITEKVFQNGGEIFNNHPHWFYATDMLNAHTTHILYYEENQEYKPHVDTARFTILTYFYKEPKLFSGGNLRFNDYDIEIECINNRVIIFPSMLQHASTPVRMTSWLSNLSSEQRPKKHGKFCITQFVYHDNNSDI